MHNILPRITLITIYNAFIQPHLDYSDVLYDQAFNISFKETLESFRYSECLDLTGTIRVCQMKNTIKNWDWSPFEINAGVEGFAFFIRSWKMNLFSLIPTRRSLYLTGNIHNIPLVNTKHNFFKNSFIHQP